MSQENNQNIFLEMPIESLNMPDAEFNALMINHMLFFRRAPETPNYKEIFRKVFSVSIGLFSLIGRLCFMILCLDFMMRDNRMNNFIEGSLHLEIEIIACLMAISSISIIFSFKRYFETSMSNVDAHQFHDELNPVFKLELGISLLMGMTLLLQEFIMPAITASEATIYQQNKKLSVFL